MVCKHVSKTE